MMRMMCDVSFKDKKASQVIVSWLGIDVDIDLGEAWKIKVVWVWFGHVKCKNKDWVSA